MPKCRTCNVVKPASEFYFRKDSNKLRTDCKTCMVDGHTCRARGIEFRDLLRMERESGGKCQCCGGGVNSTRYTRLAVDHDHKTNQVRGLLCHSCNTAIGLMDDDPMRLEQAAAYLRGNRPFSHKPVICER